MADEENSEDPEGEAPDLVHDLRQRGDSEKKRADAAERQLAFIKAGADINTGVGKLAFEKFEGEITPDTVQASIEATAAEYGFNLEPTTPTSEPEAPEVDPAVDRSRQEQAGIRNIVNQSNSSDPGTTPDPDPRKAGLEGFFAARAAGATSDDASQEYFGRIFEAAAKGDQRVLYDG